MGKRLGQHFLINKRKIKTIVDALEFKDGDTIIEIGPGRGELTREILKRGKKIKVLAIEKDPELAQKLSEKFQISKQKNVLIEGDALKVLQPLTYNLTPKTYKLIGNIPFYITGRLLRILGELEHKPTLIVLTIQKEVAHRLSAQPPRMNLLAASVQFWAEPKIIKKVPKSNFRPQPKVDGAIIRLVTRNQKLDSEKEENYYQLIKILFKQPRKTILNNLTAVKTRLNLSKEEIIKKLNQVGVNPHDRPQNLDISTIKKMGKMLYNI